MTVASDPESEGFKICSCYPFASASNARSFGGFAPRAALQLATHLYLEIHPVLVASSTTQPCGEGAPERGVRELEALANPTNSHWLVFLAPAADSRVAKRSRPMRSRAGRAFLIATKSLDDD